MMDGVKWSIGEGKRVRCLDSSKLPPARTQWTTKPHPTRKAITCPIKKQIKQRASHAHTPQYPPMSASQKPPEGQKMF